MRGAWSIRGQLLAWLIPLLVGIRLFSGYVVLQLTKSAITSAYDASLENSASALAAQVSRNGNSLTLLLPPLVDKMLRSSEQDNFYFQVTRQDGSRIGGNAALPEQSRNMPPFETVTWDGKLLRRAIRSYWVGGSGTEAEPITVQIAETMEKRSEATDESVYNLLIQQLVALLAVVSAVWYVIRRSMAPVSRIQKEIEQRSGFDFRPVEADAAPAEIQPLIHTINSLLKRVGSDIEGQRRFASNAAHQLRTPLAGVRAHAEVAKQAGTLTEARESIDLLLEGTDRCSHLIKQLLSISRVEPGARDNVTFMELDLAQIARECCKVHLAAAGKKSIDLGYEGPAGELLLEGNPTCIQEMITNLIDNAIRYSPPGSTVTVHLESSESQICLAVEDNGPGIPPEERERVFERFYRVLGSGQDGSGLGLAIVKEVAALHHASVSLAHTSSGSGLLVKVCFARSRKAEIPAKAFNA